MTFWQLVLAIVIAWQVCRLVDSVIAGLLKAFLKRRMPGWLDKSLQEDAAWMRRYKA